MLGTQVLLAAQGRPAMLLLPSRFALQQLPSTSHFSCDTLATFFSTLDTDALLEREAFVKPESPQEPVLLLLSILEAS
jgi:hypothetical protein